MTNAYEPRAIEAKWQDRWEAQGTFRAANPGDPGFDPQAPKYYVLDMFPYPSGAGLHVGHPMGYIGSDVVTRRKRAEGFNVLHPMGYDAFGLPAEQYAIQTGQHPAQTTAANIATYRRQLKLVGLSYDWERELTTSDPAYYRWTQWIFARLYDRGLAYQAEVPVWWCEALKTVLSNEEVINGRSERGDHPCERRPLKQWMLKITAYADRLLDDLDLVDWPESVKTMQREWIGRSEGAEIDFEVDGLEDQRLTVFTTRPDTLFGATFMVVAPEHPLVRQLTTDAQRAAVEGYVEAASSKSDLERTDLAKEKSGVFTGSFAVNPAFEAGDERGKIPIWVADYVLISYGSGAIMAVPGQDQRDWDFAEQYGLSIVRTVQPTPNFEGKAFTGNGPAINSGFLDGMGVADAKAAMIAHLERSGLGRSKVNYRLRDWLFSRQRYWGEPFPVLHRADGSHLRVPDAELPVELPEMVDFAPPDDGSPPLSKAVDWVRATDPATGQTVTRDTDTMPGWAGSCWYYLRFMDPHNASAPFSKEAANYWGNVDLYVGGTEHAVLHLLYARFWHKVLFDEGLVPTKEPFQQLFNQGMLTAFAYKDGTGRLVSGDEVEFKGDVAVHRETGEALEQVVAKMSKSLKNVVNPDDVCEQYGVDTFRLYEMFMGPLADSKPWNPRDVPGCRRFLDKLWRLLIDGNTDQPVRPHLAAAAVGEPQGAAADLERSLARALKRVDDSFKAFNFNTAIAALMTFVNDAGKASDALRRDQAERLVQALAPFAPHLAEELWERLGHTESLARAPWPTYDPKWLIESEVEFAVQVNGKLRGTVVAAKDLDQAALAELAVAAAGKHLEGKNIVKTIVVPGRLVNFVAK
ncbi:leucine--tRNA ligase [Engelhardtia mirabilis]|uniref:Leucine--tRNA ligase n=1 Tax=Engelhardtia mirabilis TaxID=2528011 RepID=A0A518BJV7_9BACT|nr:Leucine--tRNA ligase [Planctomycetes bacterium Pla133]QDV01580.1 Leucine--tRNA ligase [Planctomycetes bacterium Pla86]